LRQKQLCLRLVELEAAPLNKERGHRAFASGYAAEISLGIACHLVQIIPGISSE